MIKPQRRFCSRTVMKNYPFERKERRSFDTAVEFPTVEPTATEKTRTTTPAVRAACSRLVERNAM